MPDPERRPSARARMRETAGDLRTPLLVALTITTAVLGYIGAGRAHGVSHDVADRLYLTIQLFALEGQAPAPVPAALQIARLLAPLLVGYAAVAAAAVVFRDELLRGRSRMAREHTIVVGLGERGARLALALVADPAHGHAVLGIDASPDPASSARLARAGIATLAGDGTDARVLRRAGVHRARHVVLITGSDLLNIEAAGAVATALADVERQRPVVVHAVIRDLELWREMRPESVTARNHGKIRLEIVSLDQRGAAALVQALPDAAFAERHLLLVVDEHLAEETAAEALRRGRLHGDERMTLTVIGPGAASIVAGWRVQHQDLDDAADVRAVVGGVAPAGPTAGGALVALRDERAGLAAAIRLARWGRVPAEHIVVAVADAPASGGLVADRSLGFWAVGILSATIGPSLLADGTQERIARARHAHYRARRLASGESLPPAQSLVPWEELSEGLRDSNRAFADGVGEVLSALGAALVPIGLSPPETSALPLPAGVVEALAEREHARWCRQKRAQGYVPGSPRNDDPQAGPLVHPALVPYAQLPDAEREKDRESVSELPMVLAEAGFRIVLPGAPADAPLQPAAR